MHTPLLKQTNTQCQTHKEHSLHTLATPLLYSAHRSRRHSKLGVTEMSIPFSTLTLLLLLFLSSTPYAAAAPKSHGPPDDFVRSSCVHASYPNICIRTLASYAGSACKTPRDLAQAAVKVSLSRTRRVSSYLAHVSAGDSKRQQEALSDCAEQMSDSVDSLSRTLAELKHLQGGESFQWHMSNAQTWVSAALTNEDTCLDGFQGLDGKVKSDAKRKVTNLARVTSNALYMINQLDESRGRHP